MSRQAVVFALTITLLICVEIVVVAIHHVICEGNKEAAISGVMEHAGIIYVTIFDRNIYAPRSFPVCDFLPFIPRYRPAKQRFNLSVRNNESFTCSFWAEWQCSDVCDGAVECRAVAAFVRKRLSGSQYLLHARRSVAGVFEMPKIHKSSERLTAFILHGFDVVGRFVRLRCGNDSNPWAIGGNGNIILLFGERQLAFNFISSLSRIRSGLFSLGLHFLKLPIEDSQRSNADDQRKASEDYHPPIRIGKPVFGWVWITGGSLMDVFAMWLIRIRSRGSRNGWEWCGWIVLALLIIGGSVFPITHGTDLLIG